MSSAQSKKVDCGDGLLKFTCFHCAEGSDQKLALISLHWQYQVLTVLALISNGNAAFLRQWYAQYHVKSVLADISLSNRTQPAQHGCWDGRCVRSWTREGKEPRTWQRATTAHNLLTVVARKKTKHVVRQPFALFTFFSNVGRWTFFSNISSHSSFERYQSDSFCSSWTTCVQFEPRVRVNNLPWSADAGWLRLRCRCDWIFSWTFS